ncbi:MAG: hypothetical protein AAF446_06000 [Pseudomonadota bacterium]
MKKAVTYIGLIAGGFLLAASVQAQSGELSYSYIEGGYSWFDVDGGGDEDGFNIRGSADLQNGLYLHGSWDRIETREDLDTYKLGLGFRANLNDSTDWFVEASYFRVDAGNNEADDARVDLGIRTALNNNLETRVFGGFLFPDSDEYLVGADFLIKFNDRFGLSLGAETIEFDVHMVRANVRFSF